MLFKKKTLVTLCLGFSLSMPTFVFASNLVIINNTNHDSTSILNDGPCSTILGESGVTRAHKTNNVSDALLKKACIASRPTRKGRPWICKADVYMTNNCSGAMIGKATIDVNEGIQKIELSPSNPGNYVVTYDPADRFTITISGGPAFKLWIKQLLGGFIKS